MQDTGKGIAKCPACHAQYKVSLKLEGKRAACKKCGAKFLLQLYSNSGNPSRASDPVVQIPPNALPTPLQVTISDDRMTASLSFSQTPHAPITVEDIKDGLASKGVCYGIAPDEEIEELIEGLSDRPQPIIVARGKRVVEGHPSEIKYCFDTDPMEIELFKQHGVMDFRDRGVIPQVKKGALLAMKVSGSPGEPGTDVFGTEITCSKARDVKLWCGTGAKESEDHLKVHALMDGGPVLSADKKISVFSKHQIPGDVDQRTGHVECDGDIDVRGTIQDDFRVRGGRLTAGEILRADIVISSDVIALGGIIGATIHGDGNLKARYIHKARIHVLGDVVVRKEVIDSEITCSGAFLMEKGKVFNSRISAKMGITVNQIGSAVSKPCILTVGTDECAQEKIQTLKNQEASQKAKQGKLEKVIAKLQTLSACMHREISERAQVQERLTLEQRALSEEIEAMKNADKRVSGSQHTKSLENLESEIRSADERLGKRMDQQDEIRRKIDELRNRVTKLEADLALSAEDIERVGTWSRSVVGSPVVRVLKKIYSNTTIKGPHCVLRLKGNKEPSLFTEQQVRRPDGHELIWEMVVKPLS